MAGTLPTQLGAFAKPKYGQSLQDWSYSKQQVAKNNLAAEPSQGFCSRLEIYFLFE
ncbi:hypothetical protein [Companilactobacillus pabuli]|uniref:hypothetical protein n=1 Tax=Companilactobacillus pabuli TaxID=2714036 RepID=UPI002415E98E|nr:hypothetical protein [Companilactobacillus pabuli]MDG5114254.1 hypothetical protein [Companilactobacillus pabuli]